MSIVQNENDIEGLYRSDLWLSYMHFTVHCNLICRSCVLYSQAQLIYYLLRGPHAAVLNKLPVLQGYAFYYGECLVAFMMRC